jgi:heparan-alpha-glucosaminide N-acetyltransferase
MSSGRIVSIDIMRGLTLLLMLFVNDLNMDVAPAWLGHMEADFDGMGLADWVFPGFLFMVGMSIPFSFSKRISKGLALAENSKHIVTRSVSLLIIGILMLNTGRVNAELTGMSQNLWALLMYVAVFLVWNNYHDNDKKFFTVMGFKLAGIGILILLVFKFRSGMPENEGSLITGWWGILGLIGWGYLVSAFTYLLCRESILKTAAITLFFLILNILSGLKLLEFLNPVKPILGIIIEGNVPFIVLTGVTAGIILRNSATSGHKTVIQNLMVTGILYLFAGFILRRWFILSKIQATPSWGLVCSGISFTVFTLIYIITDIFKKTSWASFFRPAGENSLTTYLAPDILYYLIWMTGIPVLVYKQSTSPLIVVGGSVFWAILMVWLTALLKRLGVSLKL